MATSVKGFKAALFAALFGLGTLGLVGCDEGRFEDAGEEIDEAGDEIGDEMEDAGDELD
jgi:hypothetical protein